MLNLLYLLCLSGIGRLKNQGVSVTAAPRRRLCFYLHFWVFIHISPPPSPPPPITGVINKACVRGCVTERASVDPVASEQDFQRFISQTPIKMRVVMFCSSDRSEIPCCISLQAFCCLHHSFFSFSPPLLHFTNVLKYI